MWISRTEFKERLKELEVSFDTKCRHIKESIYELKESRDGIYSLRSELYQLTNKFNKLQKDYESLLEYFDLRQYEKPTHIVTEEKENVDK